MNWKQASGLQLDMLGIALWVVGAIKDNEILQIGATIWFTIGWLVFYYYSD